MYMYSTYNSKGIPNTHTNMLGADKEGNNNNIQDFDNDYDFDFDYDFDWEPWLLNFNYNNYRNDNDYDDKSINGRRGMFPSFKLPLPFSSQTPPRGVMQGITGLYNYKIPTDLQFAQCNDVKGLSIWDQNGWWRCLFPRDIINERIETLNKSNERKKRNFKRIDPNDFLSLEQINNSTDTNDKDKNLGLYFNDYSKYLLWKINNYKKTNESNIDGKLDNNTNDNDTNSIHSRNNDRNGFYAKITTPEDIMTDSLSDINDKDNNKKIIGKSQYISYSTSDIDGDTKKQETTTTRIHYDDGTTLIKERKKYTPLDNSEKPIIEENERIVRDSDSKSSWF